MKHRNLGLGIFILSIGILLLLANLGVINWTIFNSLLDLWPALLIMAGINIIFRHNEIVKVITWIAFLALIIAYSILNKNGILINDAKWNASKTVKYERKANMERGELKLDLGGCRFSLGSSSTDLVDAKFTDSNVKNSIEERDGGKTAYLAFQNKKVSTSNYNSNSEDARININNGIMWNIDLDAGGINGTIDMSDLKVNNLKMEIGAANVKLMFGDKSSTMNTVIDGGASNIEAYIPRYVGVKVRMDSALSSTNLNGLGWTKQGHEYTSPNYDNASIKINMDVDMGVGKFDVNMQ